MDKASKEIDFAKAEYPAILESVKSSSITNRDNDPLSTYMRLQVLKQNAIIKLQLEPQKLFDIGEPLKWFIARRQEQNNNQFIGFESFEYGEILDACKQNMA